MGAIAIIGTIAAIVALPDGHIKSGLMVVCFGTLLLALAWVAWAWTPGGQVPTAIGGEYTSRFANTQNDLDTVLRLRRAYFGRAIIVPDDAYRACWSRNRDSLKVVYNLSNQPVGYWSVFPIDASTFGQMKVGAISHGEMLTGRCLEWSSIDPANVYLYIVGVVVPPPPRRRRPSALDAYLAGRFVHDLLECGTYVVERITGVIERRRKIRAGYVLLDCISFAREFLPHVAVKGICGYPSRTAGREQLEKLGFRATETFIDGDSNQPLFILNAEEIPRFQTAVDRYLKTRKRRNRIPSWDADDRQRFLERLPPLPGFGAQPMSPSG
jgi:hypothetical protein